MRDVTSDPVDLMLADAGERWRDSQPPPAPVDATVFVAPVQRLAARFRGRTPSFVAGIASGVAAAVAVVVLAVTLFPNLVPRASTGGPGSSPTSPGASPLAGSPRGGDLAHCPVTKPAGLGDFQPDGVIPANKGWYGNQVLWTMLDRDGEVWSGLPQSETGLTQKTFWWSTLFDVKREPQPEIYVIGSRIGSPGSFGFGPGTNAGGDFGSAMLVGVDVPDTGCWNVTAHYRGTELSYVVWVGE